jgi:hypothetical protein
MSPLTRSLWASALAAAGRALEAAHRAGSLPAGECGVLRTALETERQELRRLGVE